ncbi:Sporulation-delaying protein SdpA [Nonomuraea coxensis DSM 45129]|uniref:Sporulation-delaying protein SdpA n=1 Tax=Nonomuraea coxensis DSM 45129 TaxID=1122611 RepID=A0ABX8TY72_9ACTN|nr:SdpA family antimicrobial peptide system protein [Nonomuraea coxensis]QYC40435.1 Sporulation-delaying protein SdpA [Nonomuraea coxensis DSM 45129]
MIAAWVAVIFYVVHTQLPSNAIRLPGQESARLTIITLTPQGWAFFTKSPREPQVGVWQRAAGGWRDARLGPHSEPWNALGFNRRSRSQGLELGIMQTAVPADAWRPCEGDDVSACLDRAPVAVTIRNTAPRPVHCGPVGLVQRDPLPWAWAGSETVMPAKVARLEVSC